MTATAPLVAPMDADDSALWDTWRIVERVDEELEIEGLRLYRVGLTAEDERGTVVVGSAATTDGRAATRAAFELCERAGLVDAAAGRTSTFAMRDTTGEAIGVVGVGAVFPRSDTPTRWQPSKSSGAAIARDWETACRHAELELVERDRVLRSWLGMSPAPEPIPMARGPWTEMPSYDWEARVLPCDDEALDPNVSVACVVGLPRVPEAPLLRGFGAGHDVEHARDRATLECLQSLAFLWGEPIPADAPAPSPTPLFHLDYYLWPGSHAALRAWLMGDGGKHAAPRMGPATHARRRAFVDLTPAAASGRLVLVRALDDRALSLWFGDAPPSLAAPTDIGPHPLS